MKKVAIVSVIGLVAFFWFRSEFGRGAEWAATLKTVRAKFPDVRQVSTEALQEQLRSQDAQPILIDVRNPDEYAVSRIGDAINIAPEETDFAALDSLSRDAPIVTYCSIGYRSSEMATRLKAAGFTNVSNLEGSIFKWANEGRPVNSSAGPTDVVHPFNTVWARLLKKDRRARIN